MIHAAIQKPLRGPPDTLGGLPSGSRVSGSVHDEVDATGVARLGEELDDAVGVEHGAGFRVGHEDDLLGGLKE